MARSIRTSKPRESLDRMYAFRGRCVHCAGEVLMRRDAATRVLLPHLCYCMHCGQNYAMQVADLDAFECEQASQARALRALGRAFCAADSDGD